MFDRYLQLRQAFSPTLGIREMLGDLMDEYSDYRIHIDRRWSLEDLYRFPRAYEQVYFAFEALRPARDRDTEDRIERAFRAYPWRGGYSAVSFFNELRWATPKRQQPSITSIQYASPGWLEILLNLPIAFHIGGVVTSVAGSLGICNKVYHQIHSDLQKRKLLRIEVERKKISLSREELRLIKEGSAAMADILRLEAIETLDDRTKDPLVSLKILLSVYRRVRLLAEYQRRGKADFEVPDGAGKQITRRPRRK